MKFEEIQENMSVFPGEYLLHEPTQQIGLCGAFKKGEGTIKVLIRGRLMEDTINNFRKIKLSEAERQRQKASRGCMGCKQK